MKALKLFIIGTFLLFTGSAIAQISVRLNLGSPPQWGPSGYNEARYYYLPDVEAYYDVPSSMFIYFNGISWVHRSYLPSRYRNYDLYNGYKVVMTDYRGNTPYTHFREHKRQYSKGYRGQEQHNIGIRPERENNNEGRFSRTRNNQKFNQNNNQGDRRGKSNHREKSQNPRKGNNKKN
jgi:hypothetical protein